MKCTVHQSQTLWMDHAYYVLSNNPKHAFKGCLGLLLNTGCWWNLRHLFIATSSISCIHHFLKRKVSSPTFLALQTPSPLHQTIESAKCLLWDTTFEPPHLKLGQKVWLVVNLGRESNRREQKRKMKKKLCEKKWKKKLKEMQFYLSLLPS